MENNNHLINGGLRDALLNNDVLSPHTIILLLLSKTDSQYYKDMLTIINTLFHIGINNKKDVIDRILPHIKSINEFDFFDTKSSLNFIKNFFAKCINLQEPSDLIKLKINVNAYPFSKTSEILDSLKNLNSNYDINKIYFLLKIKNNFSRLNTRLKGAIYPYIMSLVKNDFINLIFLDASSGRIYITIFTGIINNDSMAEYVNIDFISLLDTNSQLCITTRYVNPIRVTSLIIASQGRWLNSAE